MLKYPTSSGGSDLCLEIKLLLNITVLGKYLQNKTTDRCDSCIFDYLQETIVLMDTHQNHRHLSDHFR
jgi:hypothetical protein